MAVLSPLVNDLFGFAGLVIRDIDGDAIEDVVVSAPNSVDSGVGEVLGRVYVLSGADGAVVEEFTGDPGETFGIGLACEVG